MIASEARAYPRRPVSKEYSGTKRPGATRGNGARAKDTNPPPSPRTFNGFSEITSFLWSVADLLRGDYKQADYGKVILPLTVLRRLDCVLEKAKPKVLAKYDELKKAKHPEGTVDKMLLRASGTTFYNTSRLDFEKLKGDGKIARWGVSNFDVDELAQVEKAAGKGKVACNQVLYNLQERTIEHRIVPWCEERGIAVVAYTPIGGERGFPKAAALETLAQKKGLTPRQLALAFLIRRPGCFAIPKTGKADRAAENAVTAFLVREPSNFVHDLEHTRFGKLLREALEDPG